MRLTTLCTAGRAGHSPVGQEHPECGHSSALRCAPRDASTLVGLALRPSTMSGSGDKAEADGGLLQAVNERSAGKE